MGLLAQTDKAFTLLNSVCVWYDFTAGIKLLAGSHRSSVSKIIRGFCAMGNSQCTNSKRHAKQTLGRKAKNARGMNYWKMENKNQKKEMEKRNNDQKMQHKEGKIEQWRRTDSCIKNGKLKDLSRGKYRQK